ncbi:MAG: TPM domain-containing protein [Akkermansiaceae bacterium]
MQKIHRSASQCPHCGFTMSDLDAQYGSQEVKVRRLNDAAGVLRMRDRRKAEAWFNQFEKHFPQLFFSVHYGALDERANIRQFGMWLLNKAAYEDVDISRPNDGGVLLTVDVNSKTAAITFGYYLDLYLRDEDTFAILSKAHPYLLDGNHLKALRVVIQKLTAVLKKRARHANKHVEQYQRLVNVGQRGQVSAMEPLRSEQKAKMPKTPGSRKELQK